MGDSTPLAGDLKVLYARYLVDIQWTVAASIITVIAFVIVATKTMTVDREGSGHVSCMREWSGKTEERDFENGGNNQLGFRYVEFELPSGYQMNIL